MSEEGILYNPVFWVAASFVCFVGIAIYTGLHTKLVTAIDGRTTKIKAELDAAHSLRAEAQAVLDDYQKKQTEYLNDAETMLAKARVDADILRAQAEKDLLTSLDDRMKAAMERIAMEEEKAVAEVRARVVEMAMTNARTLIADRARNTNPHEYLNQALGEIERKIH